MRYHVEASQSTGRGQPRFLISRDQLEYLLIVIYSEPSVIQPLFIHTLNYRNGNWIVFKVRDTLIEQS